MTDKAGSTDIGFLLRKDKVNEALAHIDMEKLDQFLVIWTEGKVLQMGSNGLTCDQTLQLTRQAEQIMLALITNRDGSDMKWKIK